MSKNYAVRYSFLFLIFLAVGQSSDAQQLSGGLRLGPGGGISILWEDGSSHRLEGIITPRWDGIIVTGLYAWEKPMSKEEWSWFYGGGIHLGYHHRDNFFGEGSSDNGQYINQGFDLIIGVNYRFRNAPWCVSADFKPAFELAAERNVILETFGITFRYFIPRKSKL